MDRVESITLTILDRCRELGLPGSVSELVVAELGPSNTGSTRAFHRVRPQPLRCVGTMTAAIVQVSAEPGAGRNPLLRRSPPVPDSSETTLHSVYPSSSVGIPRCARYSAHEIRLSSTWPIRGRKSRATASLLLSANGLNEPSTEPHGSRVPQHIPICSGTGASLRDRGWNASTRHRRTRWCR